MLEMQSNADARTPVSYIVLVRMIPVGLVALADDDDDDDIHEFDSVADAEACMEGHILGAQDYQIVEVRV